MASAAKEEKVGYFGMVKAAFRDFGQDECAVRAAALSYYTVFALPPLLILLVMVAGLIWDPQDVRTALSGQFAGMMGESGGKQIQEMIAHADRQGSGGVWKTILSIGGLLFGATGAFLQLQGALDRVWAVKPDPDKGGVMKFITKRFLSLGMVLGLGFLLAVSLALTAGISAVGGRFGSGFPEPLMQGIEFVVSLAVLSLLFGAMFKVLPDAKVAWRDVWVGGLVTGVLFVIGKFAIGFYLGRSSPGDAFGAAGALAVILVWAYYSGMILLFGAEFTQQWARQKGSGIRPEKDAVRVIQTEELVRPGERGALQKGPTDKNLGGKKDGGVPAGTGATARGGKRGTAGARAASGRATPSIAQGSPAPESNSLAKTLLGVPVFLMLFGRGKGRKK